MLSDVVASFEERIYELGSDALSEQERQVAEVRGRGPTLLAGGGVIASLLAEPVFNGAHPDGFSEIAATAIGLLGSSAVLLFVVLLLRPDELGFSVKAGATYRALWDQDILEQPMLDIALAEVLRGAPRAKRQGRQTVGAVPGTGTLGACLGNRWPCDGGRASLIDVASPRRENTPPPSKPSNVPPPGSVPKLPQTIFNLEKKGSSGDIGSARRSGRE